jgi:hypothetical protein
MAQLEVRIDGMVAWVPRHGMDGTVRSFALLMPDAQTAERAPWAKPNNTRFPHVRMPHTALLVFDHQAAGGPINAVLSTGSNQDPHAVVLLRNSRVTINGLAQAPLTLDARFSTLPHMSEVAPGHQWARVALDPRSAGFEPRSLGLAGALDIDRGTLAVTREFNGGRDTNFGVVTSQDGVLDFGRNDQITVRPLGNEVRWTAPLADNFVDIVLTNQGGTSTYRLAATDGMIRIELLNVELEVPVFRLTDAEEPVGRDGLPDPDFATLYDLSTSAAQNDRRVPVPIGSPSGSQEKPCAPVVFSGFR